MFETFYRDYRAECAALGIATLSADELMALIAALIERPEATLQ